MDKARDAKLNLFVLHCLVTANRASNSWNRHSVLESVSTGVRLLLDLGQERKKSAWAAEQVYCATTGTVQSRSYYPRTEGFASFFPVNPAF